jgi:hypothetical protein
MNAESSSCIVVRIIAANSMSANASKPARGVIRLHLVSTKRLIVIDN